MRVSKTFTQKSRTQQSFKDECNINNIMAKYERSGIIDHVSQYQGQYGNFIGYPDYQEAMTAISQANQMFATLPASIRDRFRNDPEAFLNFAQDPDNIDELRELGLAPPAAPPAKPVEDVPAEPGTVDAPASTPAPSSTPPAG